LVLDHIPSLNAAGILTQWYGLVDRENALTIKVGLKKAKLLANILMIIAVLLLGYAQYYLYSKGIMLVFWYLLVAVQPLFLFLLYNSVKAESKEDFHFLSSACKIIMVAGILSMQLFYISF